jgi:outer membrane cobalamin receptor
VAAAFVGRVASAAEPDEPMVEIVVTGTRLSAANTSTPSPVVVVDNEELLHQGTARAEELLNTLPQVISGLTLGANGASVAPLTGTATADLRGIGAFRTLVLVNGRRVRPATLSARGLISSLVHQHINRRLSYRVLTAMMAEGRIIVSHNICCVGYPRRANQSPKMLPATFMAPCRLHYL